MPRPKWNQVVAVVGVLALPFLAQWITQLTLSTLLEAARPAPTSLPRIRMVDFILVSGVVLFTATVVLPYTWARIVLGLRPGELGVTLRGLGRGLLLGCALYLVAYLAFVLFCSADPKIADHFTRHLEGSRLVILVTGMCVIAAATDLATRGFVLLTLARYTPVWFAILVQNFFWIYMHLPEIDKLAGPQCLGTIGAYGLFLFLGIAGDVIALRTRNVVGLAIGHVLLNVAMVFTIRAF